MSIGSRFSHSIRRFLEFAARPARSAEGEGGIVIKPYKGYGSQTDVYLHGRVFRQFGNPRTGRAPLWRDLTDLWRRFLRHGKVDLEVIARFCGAEETVKTDEAGYFQVHLQPAEPPANDRYWHPVHLELTAPDGDGNKIKAEGEVFIPPPDSRYVVISDIDDTVMYTGVANKIKMVWNLFFLGAESRVGFPGVAAFYRALHRGQDGDQRNPLLYVSRGPWSLYEILQEFFRIHEIPVGPILFLRDWGITPRRPLPKQEKGHKLDLIRKMLEIYPDLPFILIGDSGQHDPDVYARISRENPDRIQAIYIRNVSRSSSRSRDIRKLAEEVVENGSTLLLVNDTIAMAEHAYESGLISEGGLESVREEKRELREREHSKPIRKVAGEAGEDLREAVQRGEVEKELEQSAEGEEPGNVVVEGSDSKSSSSRE